MLARLPFSIFCCLRLVVSFELMPAQISNLASYAAADVCKRFDEVVELNGDPFLVPCHSLDNRWILCSEIKELPVGRAVNGTNELPPNLCPYFGTSKGPMMKANLTCMALPCIECRGERSFLREFDCVKYTGHYFISALLYSMFLGFLAVDRFYLGYSAIAIAKLMTLGGFGLWWIVDILLLLSGYLMPADDSSWQPWELWDGQKQEL